jgi:murein DD-endopeptidase MepM/ murein hydrolase activator NlpD
VDHACPGGHWHSGIDLAAARGTPVMATLPGTVTVILSPAGYGLHIVIDHGGGLSSLYGHLDTVLVTSGDFVIAGQVIGTVGSSGNATGPHLHLEIRRDGIAEDPLSDLALP